MNKQYNLKLDLQFRCNNSTMKFNQFDNNTSDFFMRVTNAGKLVDIERAIVVLVVMKPSGKVASQFLKVDNELIYADLEASMKNEVGIYTAQAMLILEDERVVTDTITYEVVESNIINAFIEETKEQEDYTLLVNMLSRLSVIEISEEERIINETERILAEENRKIEEAKRAEIELIRQYEEVERSKHDTARENNENIRKQNESIRVFNENNRIDEEAKRVEEDSKRTVAEIERNSNELDRRSQEDIRLSNETERISNENIRNINEVDRIEAENQRVVDENLRKEKIIGIQNDYNSLKKVIIDENASANLQNQINNVNSQLAQKANKNEVFTMANMGQDVKEAMTGGSVAVVGKGAVLAENIVDNQVTSAKLNLPKNLLPKTFVFELGDIDLSGNPITTNFRCITDFINVKKGDYIGIDDNSDIKFKWAIYNDDDTINGFVSYRTEGYTFPTNQKIRIIQNKTKVIDSIDYMNNNIYICDRETTLAKNEIEDLINESISNIEPTNYTYYVSFDGSDDNDGLSENKPFATFEKAIKVGAKTIHAKRGDYYDTKIVKSDCEELKIIPYGEGSYINLNSSNDEPLTYPIVLTNIDNINLNSIRVTNAGVKGFKIWGCNGILTNCICEKSSSDGFSLDGSNLKLYNCIAKNSNRDGFNIHEYNNMSCFTGFYNCKSYNSGDDGISHHENCIGFIVGGEYSNNGSGGITPYGQAKVDVYNALILNNNVGVHAFQSEDILENTEITIQNCVIKNNKTEIIVQYYDIKSVNNVIGDTSNIREINGVITFI